MKGRVSILIGTALAPFLYWLFVGGLDITLFSRVDYYVLCLLYGLAWLSLYAYIYARATASQQGRLFWLLPLLLFAFTVPAAFGFLMLAFMWAAANGRFP
jgi:hypothetical protein